MKKLILISALLFSFNGWALEVYLQCIDPGTAFNQPSEWINGSCKESNVQNHYYEILDNSWQKTKRMMTKGGRYYADET